jgi:hypothetical protein
MRNQTFLLSIRPFAQAKIGNTYSLVVEIRHVHEPGWEHPGEVVEREVDSLQIGQSGQLLRDGPIQSVVVQQEGGQARQIAHRGGDGAWAKEACMS